ncbi:hypothetical protein [Pseudomonas sp. URMO17WK12:I11]|uniref:hypothetical protein n=1 Tax=Pseudomonas sp. URMO17WK12:I11 TaxID=1283291 RepID=UPI0015B69502|nr:hypothetical protein [Pseudomonas sp. URMO17WK12:I11]
MNTGNGPALFLVEQAFKLNMDCRTLLTEAPTGACCDSQIPATAVLHDAHDVAQKLLE